MKRYTLIQWATISCWLSFMLFYTRFAMLDDALIHLRYADFLYRLHHLTFDGVHKSYGTSSLLYVGLLGSLRSLTNSALLPKMFSCLCYLGMIALLGWQSRYKPSQRFTRTIWACFLVTLLSPMAIRWLTDGMETSLVGLSVMLLAIASQRSRKTRHWRTFEFVAWAVGGCGLVLLRIELASLAFLSAGIVYFLRTEDQRSDSGKWDPYLAPAALVIGAAMMLIGAKQAFGSFLPDTALAKSSHSDIIGVTRGVLHVLASAAILGIGLTILTLSSSLCLLMILLRQRSSTREYLAWLLANAPFPLLYTLACLRGQLIQGIRTILWPLLFTITWNALRMARHWHTSLPNGSRPGFASRYAVWVYGGLLILLLPFDFHYAMTVMRGRAATFLAMRDADLSRFHNSTIVAGDVGFISYFTGAPICDIYGLVNGHVAAQETTEQRVSRCVAQRPEVIFLSRDQQRILDDFIPQSTWHLCTFFDFRNVLGDDRHYIKAVSPSHCKGLSSSEDGPTPP